MLQINHAPFFSGYRKAFGALTQAQVDGLGALLRSLEADDDLDENDICPVAYMLATVKHECADTWQPIVEWGERHYFDKYEPATLLGQRQGNTDHGDGYKYRGRGYVQITGRANYARMSDILGEQIGDLVAAPSLALIPSVAYAIMATGMRGGCFTGKSLDDFCCGRVSDYVGARRVINGTDQAELVAGYACHFEAILLAATENDPGEDEQLAVPTLPQPVVVPPVPTFWQRFWRGYV